MRRSRADHTYIVCPHCDYQHGDAWEWCTEADVEREMECSGCGKRFRYWAEYSVTYYTETIEPNNADGVGNSSA